MKVIKACKELLIKEPFYGIFLLNFKKEILKESDSIKTLAVGLQGLTYILYVNENFWNTLSDEEQISVLKHELMHVCFFHLTDNYNCSNRYLMNISMDCAINQFIKNLPKGCVTLEGLSKLLNTPLEEKKGAWYYYNKIQDFLKNNKDFNIPGIFNDIDDHSIWPDDLDDAEKELYSNQIKNKIKDTAEQIMKQAGKIPGELNEIIENIKEKPPVFNWKKYFRRLVGNNISSEVLLTRMKPSKRFENARGIRLKRKPNILVGIDTSGSVNSKDFEDFFSEIKHMYKTGIDITIVECDTKITNIIKYNGKDKLEISGRGGTELTPIVDYYIKNKIFSTCILFTDGYCNKQMPKCSNLIWVITSDGDKTNSYNPGKVIFIPNR